MLVVVLLGHTPATAVGVDGFSMEASFDLFYAGLYENSGTSTNQGILPSRGTGGEANGRSVCPRN